MQWGMGAYKAAILLFSVVGAVADAVAVFVVVAGEFADLLWERGGLGQVWCLVREGLSGGRDARSMRRWKRVGRGGWGGGRVSFFGREFDVVVDGAGWVSC